MPGILPQKNEHVVPRTGWPLKVVQQRFLLLFIFLLASLLLYPYAESTAFGYFAFRIAGTAAILLSVYAASRRLNLVIWGVVLAIPAVAQWLHILRVDLSLLSLSNISLSFAFDVFIVVVLFRRVFASEKPDTETVFGALCIYMLIGVSFTGAYELLATVQPHAFYLDPATNTHTTLNRFDFIYYSFGTITSLGSSGITAVSNQARSLTVIEAMLGIFYLAVVIARLVDAYRTHSAPRPA